LQHPVPHPQLELLVALAVGVGKDVQPQHPIVQLAASLCKALPIRHRPHKQRRQKDNRRQRQRVAVPKSADPVNPSSLSCMTCAFFLCQSLLLTFFCDTFSVARFFLAYTPLFSKDFSEKHTNFLNHSRQSFIKMV
jgi:hypothetical protein